MVLRALIIRDNNINHHNLNVSRLFSTLGPIPKHSSDFTASLGQAKPFQQPHRHLSPVAAPVIGAATLRVRVGRIAISLGAVRVHVDGLGVAATIDAGPVIATASAELGCPSSAVLLAAGLLHVDAAGPSASSNRHGQIGGSTGDDAQDVEVGEHRDEFLMIVLCVEVSDEGD